MHILLFNIGNNVSFTSIPSVYNFHTCYMNSAGITKFIFDDSFLFSFIFSFFIKLHAKSVRGASTHGHYE